MSIQNNKQKIAILMMNMGGPNKLSEVRPFLEKLFCDKDIINIPFQNKLGPLIAKNRAIKVEKKYSEIGGGSPILKWTKIQGEKLINQLNTSNTNKFFKYYIGFRYASPFIEDAIENIKKDGFNKVVVFSQYPQYSCSTTGSSINKLADIFKNESNNNFEWSFIDRWPINKELVSTFAEHIKTELKKFNNPEDVILLFSAHSLPLSVVDAGDTYPYEVGATLINIMDELKIKNSYRLVYQSKVGPIRWLKPQTKEAIKFYAKKNFKKFLIIPIAFINEHIETLHELDIELIKEFGNENNLEIRRVPCPNDNPLFIKGLANLVQNHLDSNIQMNDQLLLTCPECFKSSCLESKKWLKKIKWKTSNQ